MKRQVLAFCAFLLCTTALARQDVPPTSSLAAQSSAARATDMQKDLQRMHVLLAQMQKNAAFVSPGDTPLKHEFELEIEMWQLLLKDMDQRVGTEAPR